MRLRVIIGASVTIIILLYSYNNFFTKGMLIGTYINKNYEHSIFGAHYQDTLKLLSNSQFKSSFWGGTGQFKISYSIRGTEILLNSSNSLSTYVTRGFFGKPRIVIDRDLNNYYLKQ